LFQRDKKKGCISPESSWHTKDPKGYETIVFVHGILGDSVKTWGSFPDLLIDDPDLPELDILMWGYSSGLVPDNYEDVETESGVLMSDLRLQLPEEDSCYLVAHSMGGLVALRGLLTEIENDRADRKPANNVEMVTLYGTPLEGSAAADVLHGIANSNRVFRLLKKILPDKQLRDLKRDGFVDKLNSDIEHSAMKVVPVEQEATKESFTVQAVVGKKDVVVTHKSAKGPFTADPPPLIVDGTHSTMKLPTSHLHSSYIALKRNLARKLGLFLHATSLKWKNGNSSDVQHSLSFYRIDNQYQSILQRCLTEIHGDRYFSNQEYDDVLLTFLNISTKCKKCTPTSVALSTIAVIKSRLPRT